jgi:hypothetical protein
MNNLKYAVSKMEQCFDKASQNAGKITKYYSINGHIIEISIAGDVLSNKVFPAMKALECSASQKISLRIGCFDSCSTGLIDESVPDIIGISNYRGTNFVSRDQTVYMQGTIEGAITICDRDTSRAFFWVPDEESFAFFEAAAPFRISLNWWAMTKGMQLLHAAAVGEGGRGVLLAGKSGSGKSTTAVACMAAGLDYAGDDHVFLDLKRSGRIYGIYATAKLNDDMYKKLGWLPQFDTQFPKKPGEKNTWYIKENALSKCMDIKAVLVPSVWDSINSKIIETAPIKGLLALAPSTMLYCPGGAKNTLDSLGQFVKSIPVYELRAGSDIKILTNTIREFIKNI